MQVKLLFSGNGIAVKDRLTVLQFYRHPGNTQWLILNAELDSGHQRQCILIECTHELVSEMQWWPTLSISKIDKQVEASSGNEYIAAVAEFNPRFKHPQPREIKKLRK